MKKTLLLFPIAIILVMSLFLVSCENEPELKSYTVTFLLNEGDTEPFDKKTVIEGASITDVKVPEKTGYKFLYWKTVGGGNDAYDLKSPVKGDLTLVAAWKINKYTVTFMDGEVELKEYSQSIEHGKSIEEPKVSEKEGQTFNCWSLKDSKDKYDFSSQVTGDITLVANWNINEYTVEFYNEDGTKLYGTVKAKHGQVLSEVVPKDVEETGYTLIGWTTTKGSTEAYGSDTPIKEELTLYPIWKINTYKVTFMDGEEVIEEYSQTVEYGKSIVVPKTPEKEECTFQYWSLKDSKDKYDFSTPVTGDITLVANWNIKEYKIEFYNEDGTKLYGTANAKHGQVLSEVAPKDVEETGYTLIGWTTTKGSTEAYGSDTPIKEELTLYPIWKINTYKVTFMDGEVEIADPQTVEYGKKATAPKVPTKDGHTFSCWKNVSSSSPFDFNTEVITEDTVFEAVWDTNTYKVTFKNSNGSTYDETDILYNEKVKKPDGTPTPDKGYKFKHWTTSVDTKTEYSFDTLVVGDLTLYPVWDKESYTVTFMGGEGISNVPDSQSVKYEEKATKPETSPIKTGYTFKYWATSANLETEYSFDTPIIDKLVLYPVFEINKYTVTFVGSEGISSVPEQQTVEYCGKAKDPNTTANEGYAFKGWKIEGSEVYFDFETKITSNITLYAVCKDITKVTVSFYDGNKLLLKDSYKCGEDIKFPTFDNIGTGCTITKWILADDSSAYTDTFNLAYKEDAYRFNAYIEAQYLEIDSYGYVKSITNFNSSGVSSLDIPHSIKGIEVKTIKYNAFNKCTNLTSVTIPDSVTSIGASAFYGCTGLESITIPASVTSIEDTIFVYCSNLESISVSPENGYFSSEEGIWFDKDKEKLICFPAGKTVTKYTIPNTVKTIARNAFSGCVNLTEVTIPESVNSIGYSAFSECTSLNKINVPGSVNSISCTFKGCTSLENVEIENGVEKISNSAFESCTNLTSIDIPNSVTTIGDYVFRGCTGLTSITIPSSVTFIGKYTFLSSGLTSIDIPESVNSIGQKAFATTSLENITVSAGNSFFKSIDGILFDKNGSKIVCFPAGKTVDSYTIPDGVTSIGETAFSNCKNLKEIVIPDSVTSIEGSAFTGSGLSSIVIPGSVESIGSYAFNSCTNLTSVSLSSGVKSLSGYAFYNCTSLSNLTISDTLESIGDSAFYNCTSLTSLSIPNSITTLGNNAFLNCIKLKEITINKPKDFITNAPWGGNYYYDNGLSGNRKSKQFKIVWSDGTATTYN